MGALFRLRKVKDGVIDKVIAPSATAEVTLPLGRIPSDRLVTLNIFTKTRTEPKYQESSTYSVTLLPQSKQAIKSSSHRERLRLLGGI